MIKTKINTSVSVKNFNKGVTNFIEEHQYSIFWMKEGFRSIQIDFEHFQLQPNSIYFITSGKKVKVNYSTRPKGWILIFPKEFINEHVTENLFVKNIEIYASSGQIPRIVLSPKIGERIDSIAEMIHELMSADHLHKDTAGASLLKTMLLYCDSHCNIRITPEKSRNQLYIVTKFKNLVARHYNRLHHVSDYADLMNLSAKYLNQVVKEVLGTTAKSVIQEQLLIRARRELKFSDDSIKEIAYNLGFSDTFYFSNYFKKEMGCSPTEYRTM